MKSAGAYEDIKRCVNEGSQVGTKILSRVLTMTNRHTSELLAQSFTNGTRTVFERSNEGWMNGGREMSGRVQEGLTETSREYFQEQVNKLQKSLSEGTLVLQTTLNESTATVGKLAAEMLHSSASSLISSYRTSLESSFIHLLDATFKSAKQSLIQIVKASLLNNRYYLGKHLSENIEEALESAYVILQAMIEEGARQTLGKYHACFVQGQDRLFEKMREGFEKGLDETSTALSTHLRSSLSHIHTLQHATLETFTSNLERHIQLLLTLRAKCLSQAQYDMLQEMGSEFTERQRLLIRAGLEKQFKEQTRAVEVSLLPWTLSLFETGQ
ncbi:hypothetical protein WDU94_000059, partial [Cyamophila willieti]